MGIGENIKNIRKKKGLTQKQLGEILGVSQAAIGQFESSNSNLQAETINKIATALDVDPFSLYSFEMAADVLAERICEQQNTLLENYKALNSIGKAEAQKRVAELTEIPRYTEPDEPPEE